MTATRRAIERPADAPSVPRRGAHASGRLARGMERLASGRVVLISGAVLVVAAGLLFATSASFSIPHVQAVCGATAPDVRPYTSAAGVHDFLVACGSEGRAAYRNLQLADLVYPAVVALFVASALGFVLRRLVPGRPRMVGLAVIPLLAGGFDYLENLFAWGALASFPGTSLGDSWLGVASLAKTVISWVAWSLLLGASLCLAGVEVRRRLTRWRGPAADGWDRDGHDPATVG